MSAYQLHSSDKDMVSGPSTDVGGFGAGLSSQQGFGSTSFGGVRPASGSRGRSLTPNPLPNGGGPVDSSNLLQSLFASSTPQPTQHSPNSRQQAGFPPIGNAGGMFDNRNPLQQSGLPSVATSGSGLYGASTGPGRTVVGTNALQAIFPSANTPVGAKDIAASSAVNHILGISNSTSKQKSSDMGLFGSGATPSLGSGGPLGLSENDFPSLSTNFGGGSAVGPVPSLTGGVSTAAAAHFSMPPPVHSSVGFGASRASGGFGISDSLGGQSGLYGQPPPSTAPFGSSRTMYPSALGTDPSSNFGGSFTGLMKPSDSQSEFQINNEDFPALPLQGAPGDARPGTVPLMDVGAKEKGLTGSGDGKAVGSGKQAQQGILTTPEGKVSNIPTGMIRDQFGMAGMLAFLRTIETHPSVVSLALGTELTQLGLNLTARNLYQTFAGPFMDTPCRPQDLDWPVPQEYITNLAIRDRLSPIKLNRYSDDLLFFLFYMCTGETYQLGAAIELYKRDWRYCKEERFWITRPQGMPPTEKTDTYERGMYYIFDPNNWRKYPREMVLHYAKLEQLDIPHQSTNMFQNLGGPASSL